MIEQWWRVIRWLSTAEPGENGHQAAVPVQYQGAGRFDNPRFCTAGYMAAEPQAAVGETFADRPRWSEAMLHPGTPDGATMALAELRSADRLLLDLDDPGSLIEYNLRPSDVVRRNRDRTRELGLRLFLEGKYGGVQWWSYHRPEWTVATIWEPHDEVGEPISPFSAVTHENVEPLTLEHPAVVLAAEVLGRIIEL